jgi:glycolate oxidase
MEALMSSRPGYGSVSAVVLDALRGIVGESGVLTGDSMQDYARDEAPNAAAFMPGVVVKPGDASQVSRVLRLANESKIPVTPRGAGTGLSGAAVPILGGIVLSMERMNRILEVDENNFTATVEPGVILRDLCQAVESKGLYYPVYPGEMTATLGGNVATNAGGMRAVKYGVTRNFVLGLEAALPSGEIIETGGQYIKCSSAYDLTQLITGSEGTLAVVTRIVLRLMPPPGQRSVVLAPFDSLEKAIDAVPHILRQRVLPMGIEFLERDGVHVTEEFVGKETPIHQYEASLMIIIEAENEGEATRICSDVGELCLERGAIDVFVANGERAAELLAFREKVWPAIAQGGRADMADVVVPRKHIAEFVRKARQASRDVGVGVFLLGHAGDGNVHISPILPDVPDGAARMADFFHRVYELGISMGGAVSGEHGIGYLKKPYLESVLAPAKLDLMKRIKLAFDPNNIMNPGKIFDI